MDGRPVELTAREFELLAFLMHAPGRVFTREQIYEGVWGYSYLGDSKVIDFFVSSLRSKLAPSPEGSLIRTVRGVGYTIRHERPHPADAVVRGHDDRAGGRHLAFTYAVVRSTCTARRSTPPAGWPELAVKGSRTSCGSTAWPAPVHGSG